MSQQDQSGLSGLSGSARMIGTLVGRRAEEEENNTDSLPWRIARRVRFGTPTASAPLRIFVFGPGQGEPDIGTGIIDCVQVT